MFVPLMYALARVPRHQGSITPGQLTAVFRQSIKNPLVKVTTQRHGFVETGQVCVSGNYDPDEDQARGLCVEVNLLYHPDQQHLVLDQTQWRRLCFDVAECVGHEFVHREQAKRRKYRAIREYASHEHCSHKKEEQEYLGTREEIEAYGFSIAAELSAMHGTFSIDSPELENIVMWRVYSSAFDTDQSVVLKLRQQISKYLCRLEADYHDQQNSKRPRSRSRRT